MNMVDKSELYSQAVTIFSWTSKKDVSSVTQSCPTLWDPMNCSTPGFPVLHQLPELAQTHVHWISDAIQPSQPLSSLSPPAFNLSQHQGVFQWLSSWHQVAKGASDLASVFPINIQVWFPLGLTGLISLQSKGFSKESSPTPQFKSCKESIQFNNITSFFSFLLRMTLLDSSGGPVVKNPPAYAEDIGLIPAQKTKIPHALQGS